MCVEVRTQFARISSLPCRPGIELMPSGLVPSTFNAKPSHQPWSWSFISCLLETFQGSLCLGCSTSLEKEKEGWNTECLLFCNPHHSGKSRSYFIAEPLIVEIFTVWTDLILRSKCPSLSISKEVLLLENASFCISLPIPGPWFRVEEEEQSFWRHYLLVTCHLLRMWILQTDYIYFNFLHSWHLCLFHFYFHY